MSDLRWNPVAAPDFSSSMEGVRSAAAMIQQALGNAQAGIKDFQEIHDQSTNKAFLEHMLQYQDPEAYKAALASGALYDGIDKSALTGDSLMAAGNRVGTLLNQANTEFQMGKDKYGFAREQATNAARDAASPLQQQMLVLAGSGNLVGAQKIFDANRDVFGKLGYNDFSSTIRDTISQATARQGYDQSNTRFGNEQWRFGREVSDAQAQDAAVAAVADIKNHAFDPKSAETYINGQKYAPKVEALIRSSLGLSTWGDFAADPSFGNLGGGGGSNDNPWTTQVGGGSMPNTVKTLGDAVNYGQSVLIPQTRNSAQYGLQGTGMGTSAMGAFQIVSSTMEAYGKKLFGADWKNKEFTPQVQTQIAEAIFKDNKDNPRALRKQWVALSPAEAAFVAEMPTPQALAYIAAKESGASATAMAQAQIGQAANQAERGYNMGDQYGAINAGTNADTWANTQVDRTPVGTVIKNLQKSTFPDATPAQLLGRIRDVQVRAKNIGKDANGKPNGPTLSDATAADIIARSVNQSSFSDRVIDFYKSIGLDSILPNTGSVGGGLSVDNNIVDTLIRNAIPKTNKDGSKTSQNQDIVGNNAKLQTSQQQRDQAAAAVAAAMADLARAQAAVAAGRQVDLTPYRNRLAIAQSLQYGAEHALDPVPEVAPPPANNPPRNPPARSHIYIPPPLPKRQQPVMVNTNQAGWSLMKR